MRRPLQGEDDRHQDHQEREEVQGGGQAGDQRLKQVGQIRSQGDAFGPEKNVKWTELGNLG